MQADEVCDVQGGAPKVQAALELYNILSESNIDLRQPVGLEEQLLKDDALDSEVGQSMLQLLQVCQHTNNIGQLFLEVHSVRQYSQEVHICKQGCCAHSCCCQLMLPANWSNH